MQQDDAPEQASPPTASLEEAALFYDRRLPGLGQRFLANVEKAIELILLFPEAAPVIGKTVRQKVLSRFPYSLIYVFEKNAVFFLAVAHQKQKPMYWKDRLPRS